MVKRNLKVVFCTFMVGILLGISTAAYAASLSSSWKYYGPVNGYKYKNQAVVSTHSGIGVSAHTQVSSDGSGNIPIGYMGAKAMLYKENGDLWVSTSWEYNDIILYGFAKSTSVQSASSGSYYYSKGKTKAYHGDGYNEYWTFSSPNIKYN
ncbi:MAG: hypothetical protein AB1815_03590 [Bacillota bacterium]